MINHNITTQETILIVDDNLTNSQILLDFVSEAGFNVILAEDGERAITQAEAEHPDLILLDVIMPGIDGFETCRRLKANPLTAEIPVIFLTALSQTAVIVKGFELGAVDYIIKPSQQEIVLARINTHLTIKKLRQSLQVQNQQLQQEIQQRQQAEAKLQKANAQLKRLATLDSLTEVANRHRFDEYFKMVWRIARREQWVLSLILCDVDYFKLYNDTKGHQAGDKCLYQVAQAIKQVAKRPADLVARYGGEEFAVILPNTPAKGALQVTQFIQSALKQLGLTHPRSPINDLVTLSMGVSSTVPCDQFSPETLLTVADQALYRAKEMGRDRAVLMALDDPLVQSVCSIPSASHS